MISPNDEERALLQEACWFANHSMFGPTNQHDPARCRSCKQILIAIRTRPSRPTELDEPTAEECRLATKLWDTLTDPSHAEDEDWTIAKVLHSHAVSAVRSTMEESVPRWRSPRWRLWATIQDLRKLAEDLKNDQLSTATLDVMGEYNNRYGPWPPWSDKAEKVDDDDASSS